MSSEKAREELALALETLGNGDFTPEQYELLSSLDQVQETNMRLVLQPPLIELLGQCRKLDHCAICCDNAGEVGLQLPCRHSFHRSCITKWLCEEKDSYPICGLSADPEKHAQHALPNTRASQQKHGEENDAEPEDEDGASGFYRSDDLNSENEKKETNAECRILAKVKKADVVAVLEGKDPESVSFGEVFRLLENRLQLPDSFFDAEDQKMKVRKRVVKIIEHREKKKKRCYATVGSGG